ncbi:MAG: rhomboid family intramembrane serine protease [Thermodesulfobacteriota bacterium]
MADGFIWSAIFIFQLVQGFYLSRFSFSGGGVAWFAHIGGFFAGLFLAKYFKKPDFPLWGIF